MPSAGWTVNPHQCRKLASVLVPSVEVSLPDDLYGFGSPSSSSPSPVVDMSPDSLPSPNPLPSSRSDSQSLNIVRLTIPVAVGTFLLGVVCAAVLVLFYQHYKKKKKLSRSKCQEMAAIPYIPDSTMDLRTLQSRSSTSKGAMRDLSETLLAATHSPSTSSSNTSHSARRSSDEPPHPSYPIPKSMCHPEKAPPYAP